MNFLSFHQTFSNRLLISTNDILKRYPGFDTGQLIDWQKKGYLIKLINRYYTWKSIVPDEPTLFFFANKLVSPSYISTKSALRFYDFIPEGVYQTFSVTTKKTIEYDTLVGKFNYNHVKPDLYFGFQSIPISHGPFNIAEPEKAILDTFYLNPELHGWLDILELRLNIDEIRNACNLKKLKLYSKIFSNKRVDTLLHELINQINDKSYIY